MNYMVKVIEQIPTDNSKFSKYLMSVYSNWERVNNNSTENDSQEVLHVIKNNLEFLLNLNDYKKKSRNLFTIFISLIS